MGRRRGLDDHGDTQATATVMPGLGTPVSGVIEYSGDADWFRITVPAGAHTATVAGPVAATLRTAAGAWVGSVYGSTSFSSPGQDYTLEVRGNYGTFPSAYTVTVQ